MHAIEPHYNWRNLYVADEDERSPFHGREYSELEFTNTIYDHYIHPQWDYIGSPSMFIKILYVNYDEGSCIIELIGEWNDTLHNDIMQFKRNVLEDMMLEGINKFILIGENVLIFHGSDDCYYEEWREEIEDGWIALVNFHPHVIQDMKSMGLQNYMLMEGKLDDLNWRTFNPDSLISYLESYLLV
ncbi:MAG: hypothetical protein RIC15_00970 [Vicingaceae bacterium]